MGQKMLTDANRRLIFVPDLANYHSPTVAELTGVGVLELSCNVTAANYALGSTGDDAINDPAACASSNSTVPGRTNYEAAFDMFRWKDAADDKAWTTFTGKGIEGYLVERIGQIADGEKAHEVPFAAADEVRVFHVLTGTPQVLSPSGAGYEKFKVNFSVQDNVDERAVVAAA
jgi:hypothetical protein